MLCNVLYFSSSCKKRAENGGEKGQEKGGNAVPSGLCEGRVGTRGGRRTGRIRRYCLPANPLVLGRAAGGEGRGGGLHSFVFRGGRGRREEVGGRGGRGWAAAGAGRARRGGWRGSRGAGAGVGFLCVRTHVPGEAPAARGAQCGRPHPVRSRASAPRPRGLQPLRLPWPRVGSARSPAGGVGGTQRHAPHLGFQTPSLGFGVRPAHCRRPPPPAPASLFVPSCGGRSGAVG